MKNRFALVLIILSSFFFIATIGSCINAARIESSRDKEMFTRMDLEEKINKITQDKTALETKVSNFAKDLEVEKATHQETKKELMQERLINQSLKDELTKVTKTKESLEEAIAGDKSFKGKR